MAVTDLTPEDLAYSIRLELEDGTTLDIPFDSDPSDLTPEEWVAIKGRDLSVLPESLTNEQGLAALVIYQKVVRHTDWADWADFGPFVARLLLGDETVVEVT